MQATRSVLHFVKQRLHFRFLDDLACVARLQSGACPRSVAPAKPAPPEKPRVDVSGAFVGAAVSHAKFGTGKVIELGGGYVTVSFEQGEKRFMFPDAFESGFLKAQ